MVGFYTSTRFLRFPVRVDSGSGPVLGEGYRRMLGKTSSATITGITDVSALGHMALVGKGFSKYLNTLFNDPELSDVAIVLDNDEGDGTSAETKTFHGHRVILATVSDYFRSMLYGSFVEATKKEIRLPGVPYSDECGSKFNETANEHLENSTFVDLPLRAVQMILDTSNICCTRAELKRAIQAWIEHHKGEISADVAAELNRKVYRFGRLCYDFKILSISRTKAMQKPEDVQPLGGCAESMEALLAEPHEYSYISQTKVLKCICLRGAKICLRANQKFGPEHGRIKSEFELQFIVEGYGRLHRRNLTVRYDLTQHEQQSVTIFFPKMACCKDTNVGFWLRWKGTGVQPVLQNYVAAKNNKTIEADSTYVTHIIYEDQVYDCNNRCPECPVPYVYDWYSSSS
ncbi:conserved hypothetical protein [Culex quinquefasciatus]|uniref:BTB domain-containing protein n=1 Tax=Culex quinquefasciatus TaxID=7176 RepID=B0W2Y3_CULQU|nr:conserved hypothetical protein [Culex quinquefasciatus]|eukprot:XP_001843067.1 conserved hypothetical protein [Culex quinquefasciatus]